jgi:hypothetical protein
MYRKFALSLACLLVSLGAVTSSIAKPPGVASPQLNVSDPVAIAVADSLSKHIDAMSGRVAECIAAKAAPAALCFCRYPDELRRLRSQYRKALAAYPAWRGKLVSWSPRGQSGSRTISMDGLERQLSQKCPT